MRLLGWYTLILDLVVISLFILLAAGRAPKPPLSVFEDIAWAVSLVPVAVLGAIVARQRR